MNKLLSLTFSCFLLFSLACGNSSQSNEQNNEQLSLNEKVMAVHDEVMPKMTVFSRLKDSLTSLLENKNVKADSTKVNNLTSELSRAHEDMMEWMRNWEDSQDSSYLLKELDKIKRVKKNTLTSIKQARKYLRDYDNQ